MDHRTRIVECTGCGEATAYVDVPDGARIVSDDAAGDSATACCQACGHEFRVSYAVDD